MTFFDNLYKKLFAQKSSHNPKIYSDVIERNSKYRFQYDEWKESSKPSELIALYSRSYYLKQTGIQNDPEVHLFTSQAANGFALTYSPLLSREEFQYLFDWLADKVKLLGYRLVNSDVQITEKPEFMETKEKHYLKPPLGSFDSATDQFYGNILVEYVMVNDEPGYIKLLANTYSDRLYLEPRPHSELINYLLESPQ